jgi:hypothetical protein
MKADSMEMDDIRRLASRLTTIVAKIENCPLGWLFAIFNAVLWLGGGCILYLVRQRADPFKVIPHSVSNDCIMGVSWFAVGLSWATILINIRRDKSLSAISTFVVSLSFLEIFAAVVITHYTYHLVPRNRMEETARSIASSVKEEAKHLPQKVNSHITLDSVEYAGFTIQFRYTLTKQENEIIDDALRDELRKAFNIKSCVLLTEYSPSGSLKYVLFALYMDGKVLFRFDFQMKDCSNAQS